MLRGFSVTERDTGHWDIYGDKQREFCIRGEPGNVMVRDERGSTPYAVTHFKSVPAAFLWIADHYMN